jgi:hypothetical protein
MATASDENAPVASVISIRAGVCDLPESSCWTLPFKQPLPPVVTRVLPMLVSHALKSVMVKARWRLGFHLHHSNRARPRRTKSVISDRNRQSAAPRELGSSRLVEAMHRMASKPAIARPMQRRLLQRSTLGRSSAPMMFLATSVQEIVIEVNGGW